MGEAKRRAKQGRNMTTDRYNKNLGIAMSDYQYAAEWLTSSAVFAKNGHYEWMRQQLPEGASVIEVGCGAGLATLELTKSFKRVISLEISQASINHAQAHLNDRGIPSIVVQANDASKVIEKSEATVYLVHGDVFDGTLEKLYSYAKPSAIACWLIGASPDTIADHYAKPHQQFDGGEITQYRHDVQQRCFEIGERYLLEDGIVHIVNRMGLPQRNAENAFRRDLALAYQDMAGAAFSVNMDDTVLRQLDMELASSRIQYMVDQPINQVGLVSTKAART